MFSSTPVSMLNIKKSFFNFKCMFLYRREVKLGWALLRMIFLRGLGKVSQDFLNEHVFNSGLLYQVVPHKNLFENSNFLFSIFLFFLIHLFIYLVVVHLFVYVFIYSFSSILVRFVYSQKLLHLILSLEFEIIIREWIIFQVPWPK